jgi:glutathione synthase/RimK-type ligase-like ATP-grasp enzyme
VRPVLLAVDASTPDLTADDRVLADALQRRGISARPLPWGTPVAANAVVVIRSTWDYVDRPADFAAWLDLLDDDGVTVVNPTVLLRWSMHKGYLLELARGDVPVVPTVLLPRGDTRPLDAIRVANGWGEVVVKPAVGGTARATVHSGRIGGVAAASHLARLVAREDALVQPVVDSIGANGEVSVIAVDGMSLTAILKQATPGEWRVQSDFGGTARRVPLTDDLAQIAADGLTAVGAAPVYARVDVARLDGRWAIVELELIEPELFFRLDPLLAERFADALLPVVG